MNNTAKAISSVTILLFFSKILGFVREVVIAAYYGATYQTDAYNMAIMIVGLSTAILSTGVATVIIPMYNHKRVQKSKEEADLFANNILWITSVFYIALSIIGIIFAPILVKIFAINFEVETAALTVSIIRIVLIFSVVVNISNYLMSIAKIFHKFAIVAISGYPLSIFGVLFTVFFARYIGIYALVIGYVLFLLCQAIILILSVRKIFKFEKIINFTNGDLKDVVKLSLPIYISVGIWEINAIVSNMLASGLAEGSISALNYSLRLWDLPTGMITVPVTTVIFPLLSQYAAKKDFMNLKILLSKSISILCLTLIPITFISVYYAGDIVRMVFERGMFTEYDTMMTSNILKIHILSVVFNGGAYTLANTFYSVKDTKTPQLGAAVTVASTIVLSFIFIGHMKAVGLALASTIAVFIHLVILFILFRRKFGAFGGLTLLKNIIKYSIAAASMIPVFILCEFLREKISLFFFITLSVVISLGIYALLLYFLKAELFIEILVRVKKFLENRLKKVDNNFQ
jgi:putative peptidoglycan lipid II flippase